MGYEHLTRLKVTWMKLLNFPLFFYTFVLIMWWSISKFLAIWKQTCKHSGALYKIWSFSKNISSSIVSLFFFLRVLAHFLETAKIFFTLWFDGFHALKLVLTTGAKLWCNSWLFLLASDNLLLDDIEKKL